MADADYCTSCGERLHSEDRIRYDDLILDRYRVQFRCPECGYHGEVFRHGK